MSEPRRDPAAMLATTHAGPRSGLRQMLNKVPEVTAYFWVIKVLCTTVGKTASDYLSDNVGLGLTNTTYITAALLVATLVFHSARAATSQASTGSSSSLPSRSVLPQVI